MPKKMLISLLNKMNSKKHIEIPSNKKFGIFLSVIFLFLACYFFLKHSHITSYLLGSISALFLFAAFLAPAIFYPLNKSWYILGLVLGRLVSPLILASIFFLLITPIALITRLFGRDVLLLKKKTGTSTYWVDRESNDSQGSFTNQF